MCFKDSIWRHGLAYIKWGFWIQRIESANRWEHENFFSLTYAPTVFLSLLSFMMKHKGWSHISENTATSNPERKMPVLKYTCSPKAGAPKAGTPKAGLPASRRLRLLQFRRFSIPLKIQSWKGLEWPLWIRRMAKRASVRITRQTRQPLRDRHARL